jgi:hypothetical protein
MIKKSSILLAVLIVVAGVGCFFYFYNGGKNLSAAESMEREGDGTGQAAWGKAQQIEKGWIAEQNAKLIPREYKKTVVEIDKLAVYEDKFYLPLADIPFEKATQLGIPVRTDISKFEKMKDSFSVELTDLGSITLNGQVYFLATYKDKDSMQCFFLYLQTKLGLQMVHYSEDGCNEIHFVTPNPKMPSFVLETISGCGSGQGRKLYEIQKDGSLKEDGSFGGWHAGGICFLKLDGDEISGVLDSADEVGVPDDLKVRLKGVRGFDLDSAGAQIRKTRIFKWSDGKFSILFEYYGLPEE